MGQNLILNAADHGFTVKPTPVLYASRVAYQRYRSLLSTEQSQRLTDSWAMKQRESQLLELTLLRNLFRSSRLPDES